MEISYCSALQLVKDECSIDPLVIPKENTEKHIWGAVSNLLIHTSHICTIFIRKELPVLVVDDVIRLHLQCYILSVGIETKNEKLIGLQN